MHSINGPQEVKISFVKGKIIALTFLPKLHTYVQSYLHTYRHLSPFACRYVLDNVFMRSYLDL